MQYPGAGQVTRYRVSVPELNGGINYAVPAHRIADNQLSDSVNMWYRNGALKTRPAMKGTQRFSYEEPPHTTRCGSIGAYGYVIAHSEHRDFVTLLHEDGTRSNHVRSNSGGSTNIMLAAINSDRPTIESEDNVLAFLKGDTAYNTGVFGLSESSWNWTRQTPYVPTVLMNGRAQDTEIRVVNGDQLEPYNLLSDEYSATFTTGDGKYFFLPTAGDDVTEVLYKATVRGESTYVEMSHTLHYDAATGLYLDDSTGNVQDCGVAYNKLNGSFYFYELPTSGITAEADPTVAIALPEGVDNNIVVRVKRADGTCEAARNTILNMRFSTWYGGGSAGLTGGTRLFVGGNADCPNLVHWSALNDPLYFPENNYAYVGEDTDAVTAFGKQNDMLVIFKECSLFYTTYVQGGAISADSVESQETVDIEAAAVMFPMMQIHPEIGCDCPNTIQLCHNRLVWLNSDGRVYGLFSSGVYNERNLRCLSLQLGDRLRAAGKARLQQASATRYEEQYLLLIGDRTIYAMDFSSYGFQYYGSYSSDEKAQRAVVWHRWESSWPLEALVRVHDTTVIVGSTSPTEKHLSVLENDGTADTCYGETEQRPIQSSFSTKLFDMGRAERYKRVDSMYLQIAGEAGKTAHLTYCDGSRRQYRADTVVLTDTGEPTPQRIRTNMVRVRSFGFELNSTCRMAVGTMIINYEAMGEIR